MTLLREGGSATHASDTATLICELNNSQISRHEEELIPHSPHAHTHSQGSEARPVERDPVGCAQDLLSAFNLSALSVRAPAERRSNGLSDLAQ